MPLGCISYLNPEWNFTGVRGMSGSCEQNNTYNNTVLNIFSCCWTGSNSSHFPEMLTVSAVKLSKDCVCNKCNERHNRRAYAHTSLGNALRNAWRGASLDESVGTCGVKCVAVSRYSDYQIIRSDMVTNI